jgi:hypothetical protein
VHQQKHGRFLVLGLLITKCFAEQAAQDSFGFVNDKRIA